MKSTEDQLKEAQAAIVAMLQECGLSQVIISADGKHNRYSRRGSNIYYTFGELEALYKDKRPLPKENNHGLDENLL